MQAYSKAAKRAAKRARKGVADLQNEWKADVAAEIATEPADDPLATVMQARARQTGKPEGEVLRPIFGEEAGRAISAECARQEDADKLWKLFLAFDRTEETYAARVIGRSRFPNVSKLEFMPERFETRPDDRPDLRTDDEKHRDAVNAWMRWRGYLGHLSSHERVSITRASRQEDELFKDGRATVHGKSFVAALRVLRQVVDGNNNHH